MVEVWLPNHYLKVERQNTSIAQAFVPIAIISTWLQTLMCNALCFQWLIYVLIIHFDKIYIWVINQSHLDINLSSSRINNKLTPRSLLPLCTPQTLRQSGQDQQDWHHWRQNERGKQTRKEGLQNKLTYILLTKTSSYSNLTQNSLYRGKMCEQHLSLIREEHISTH